MNSIVLTPIEVFRVLRGTQDIVIFPSSLQPPTSEHKLSSIIESAERRRCIARWVKENERGGVSDLSSYFDLPYYLDTTVWVKEKWRILNGETPEVKYFATSDGWDQTIGGFKWKSAESMPKRYSRLSLNFIEGKACRIKDLQPLLIERTGMDYEEFRKVFWNIRYGTPALHFSANPMVFVYGFKTIINK